jgi:hypothetical protein
VKPDPKNLGQGTPDPARGPSQRGAKRQPLNVPPTDGAADGSADDRGTPADSPIGEEVRDDLMPVETDLHEQAPPRSRGWVRCRPI